MVEEGTRRLRQSQTCFAVELPFFGHHESVSVPTTTWSDQTAVNSILNHKSSAASFIARIHQVLEDLFLLLQMSLLVKPRLLLGDHQSECLRRAQLSSVGLCLLVVLHTVQPLIKACD